MTIAGFDSPGRCAPGAVKKDAVYTCTPEAHVPADAKLTTPYFTDDYWKHPAKPAINMFEPGVPFGVPFAPTPFRVTFHVKAGSADVTQGTADSVPLREGHLQRRQAHGAERGPGVFGEGDAAARGDSGAGSAVFYFLLSLTFVDALQRQWQFNIFKRCQSRHELEVLKDETEMI